MHMRAKEFTTFAFHIDDNALPVLETGFQVTVIKPKDKPLTALDEDVHTNVLRKIFEQHKPERYTDMVSLLIEGYSSAGYKRGNNGAKDLLKALSSKKIIVKGKNGYEYHPENFSSNFTSDDEDDEDNDEDLTSDEE